MTARSRMTTANLKQTAVYWGGPASDGFGGRTFDEAVEISVRWEERSEMFRDAAGQEARSSTVVYVGADLDLGGYLYLGTLSDLASDEEADPLVVENAFEIRGWSKIPSVKADLFVRKLWL